MGPQTGQRSQPRSRALYRGVQHRNCPASLTPGSSKSRVLRCSLPVVRSNSFCDCVGRGRRAALPLPAFALTWAEAGGNTMPHRVNQEDLEKATQDTPPPAPCSRRKRVASVLRASWYILRHWRPARSDRPPEMHAIDHLARDHPRAFI